MLQSAPDPQQSAPPQGAPPQMSPMPPTPQQPLVVDDVFARMRVRQQAAETEANEALAAARRASAQMEETFHQPAPTPPAQAWGSAAMALAALGGLLTKTPAATAMGAMANVLNAYKEGDNARTQMAYEQWKTAHEAAQKMIELELHSYDAAIRKMSAAPREAQAELAAQTAAYKNMYVNKLINEGHTDQALQILAGAKIKLGAMTQAGTAFQASHDTQMKIIDGINSGDQNKMADAVDLYADTLAKTTSGKNTSGQSREEAFTEEMRLKDLASRLRNKDPNVVTQAMSEAKRLPSGGTAALKAPKPGNWTPAVDSKNGTSYIYRVIDDGNGGAKVEARTMTGEPYTPTGILHVAGASSATMPDDRTPDQRKADAAIWATGAPPAEAVPGWGASATVQRKTTQHDAIQMIQDQMHISPEEAGVELSRRRALYAAQKSSTQQLDKMVGATRQAVSQLTYNVEQAQADMAKLPSTNLSPILNAIARKEQQWTGEPAYSQLFFHMHAVAMESARILSSGQASVAQVNVGPAELAQQWANDNMTPASFAGVADAIIREGEERIQTYTDAMHFQNLMPGETPMGGSMPTSGGGGGVPTVTQEQYNTLPSGSHYKIPGDPKTYVKQ